MPLGSTPVLRSYKGYGLSLMVDIFSGVLSGLGSARMLSWDTWEMGHFLGAWRIDAFRPVEEFKAMMDETIRDLRATKPAPGAKGVLIPGEKEFYTERERRVRGIPLYPKVVAPLVKLGEELGLPFPA